LIESFFFDSGGGRVFATYHPPANGSGLVLTVICPPLLSEYMRTQLALRQLAITLAEQGQHVLRFDYRGTGDSCGELADMSVSDWEKDIAGAIREACDLTGSSVVRLLGVRAGALLACRAAATSRAVQRVVLWDPVPDGAGYVQSLRRMQVTLLERNIYLGRRERRQAMHEYAGYVLSSAMLEDLHSLDGGTYAQVPAGNLHVVTTSREAVALVPGASCEVLPFVCNWEKVTDDLLMPRPVMERLTECLTQQ